MFTILFISIIIKTTQKQCSTVAIKVVIRIFAIEYNNTTNILYNTIIYCCYNNINNIYLGR